MHVDQEHKQLVFQEKKELKRLHIQNRLLGEYEKPVFDSIFSGRDRLSVLDIGCNDGTKTVEWFSNKAVSKVIGLEYNEELAKKAQNLYGDEKFSFYPMDIESSDFSKQIKIVMKEKEIGGFDVIYFSLVLMHLTDAKRVVETMGSFLKEDGQVVIIESNDNNTILVPDKKGLLPQFLHILKEDKYSGNRNMGNEIYSLLTESGYDSIKIWHDSISAGAEEKEKKKDIFRIFFSYLSEDVDLLLQEEPNCEEYQKWNHWLEENYRKLKCAIVQSNTTISMGIKILTCSKGKK